MIMHGFGIPVFLIIFILLLFFVFGVAAFAIVFLLRKRQAVPTASPMMKTDEQDSAMTILRERFAQGEISKVEYDKMHQTLA